MFSSPIPKVELSQLEPAFLHSAHVVLPLALQFLNTPTCDIHRIFNTEYTGIILQEPEDPALSKVTLASLTAFFWTHSSLYGYSRGVEVGPERLYNEWVDRGHFPNRSNYRDYIHHALGVREILASGIASRAFHQFRAVATIGVALRASVENLREDSLYSQLTRLINEEYLNPRGESEGSFVWNNMLPVIEFCCNDSYLPLQFWKFQELHGGIKYEKISDKDYKVWAPRTM